MPKNRTLAVLLSLVFVAGLVLGGAVIIMTDLNPLSALAAPKEALPSAPVADTEEEADVPAPLVPAGGNDVAETVKKVGPAVVKIETMVKENGRRYDPFFNDPFFRQFFGNQFQYPQQPRVSTGMGSGFIVSEDGYILTNEHVIAGADEIKVEVSGYDEPFTAEVVGSDYDLDLAVLKINAQKDLPVLKLGSSQDTNVGDWVIAIGNPYGLDHTVTVGVISAKGRPVNIQDRQYKNLLQTDASINPGNSGGPLLNMQGEVVGINTAINASAQGIGFAIPTSTVKEVFAELKEKGHVVRPYLGVWLQPVTEELAQYFKLGEVKGVLVADVAPGSPAHAAGLRQGDAILEFDKQEVNNPEQLVKMINEKEIGNKVVMRINRAGSSMFVTVTIGEKGQVSQ